MQGELWQAVFRRIPAAKHDSLIIVTATGIELIVNKILRLDEHYLLLRARLSGATDAGRIIILPYDQINNVAFAKILPESEVQAIFGSLDGAGNFADLPAAGVAPHHDNGIHETDGEEESEDVEDEGVEPVATPQASVTPAATSKPSKSVLLARLRARLGNEQRMT